MGTFTAQILIGEPHQNHDGIIPYHQLFLSENSRPAWMLREIYYPDDAPKTDAEKTVWIPTMENMLEDALLMIAVHIIHSPDILNVASAYTEEISASFLELYSAFKDEELEMLYEKCRGIEAFPKLAVSVFRHSTIAGQLSVLQKYKMDVEVCTPVYSRLYSPWKEKTLTEGSLD